MKARQTLSRATTLEYVMEVRGLVTCPPATKRALRVKSIFTSNIIWHGIHFDPIGAGLPGSKISKAGETWSISFAMVLAHRSVPVSLSIS
jgi:hypothetical protein